MNRSAWGVRTGEDGMQDRPWVMKTRGTEAQLSLTIVCNMCCTKSAVTG